jgi:excisionase family DNA binding protein
MEALNWTLPELARALGVERTTIWRAATTSQLPAARAGRIWLVSDETVRRLKTGEPLDPEPAR